MIVLTLPCLKFNSQFETVVKFLVLDTNNILELSMCKQIITIRYNDHKQTPPAHDFGSFHPHDPGLQFRSTTTYRLSIFQGSVYQCWLCVHVGSAT